MAETSQRRSILAGLSGNVLEWYDFALYGYFAPTIAEHFFPSQDKLASLFATFGVFAVGYLMRPIGGVLFGRLADRSGRKRALQLSVLLMAIPTFLVGLLPTYAQIGVASSVLLTLLRLLQGCSVGGEFVASISFLADHSPPGKRYFYGSWASFGALTGMMLGSAAGAVVTSVLGSDQVAAWGWRIPFLCGICLSLAAIALRQGGDDQPLVASAGAPTTRASLTQQRGLLLKMTLGIWVFSLGFYMLFLYLSTYLSTQTSIPQAEALRLNTVCMGVLILMIPFFGKLCDRFSGKAVILLGNIGLGLSAIPLFILIDQGSERTDLLCQLVFAVFVAMQQAAYPAFMTSVFPISTRSTSVAISYNIAIALFGGTTPLVATGLIARFGDKLAPSYYLTAAAIVSSIAIAKLSPQKE